MELEALKAQALKVAKGLAAKLTEQKEAPISKLSVHSKLMKKS